MKRAADVRDCVLGDIREDEVNHAGHVARVVVDAVRTPAHAHAIAASSAEAAGGEEEGEASEEELAGLRLRLRVALDDVHSQALLLQAAPPTTPAGAR